MKLKASYGLIGDQGVSRLYGWQIYSINQTPDGSYSFTQSSTLANPNLTWETSKVMQVGFESVLFNDKLSLDVDYYIKNTENLFFSHTLPCSIGSSSITYNDGVLRNKGLEYNLGLSVIDTEDFDLSFNLNGEIFSNEIAESLAEIN